MTDHEVKLLDIQDRLDKDEEVSEEECLEYMQWAFEIPLEVLEARLDVIRGEDLMEIGCDLPMTGNTQDEDYENENLEWGDDEEDEK